MWDLEVSRGRGALRDRGWEVRSERCTVVVGVRDTVRISTSSISAHCHLVTAGVIPPPHSPLSPSSAPLPPEASSPFRQAVKVPFRSSCVLCMGSHGNIWGSARRPEWYSLRKSQWISDGSVAASHSVVGSQVEPTVTNQYNQNHSWLSLKLPTNYSTVYKIICFFN